MRRPAWCASGDLRRRAGRVQPHLCGGDLDAGLPDWIAAHVNALTSLGGVPRQIVSDDLKAGITKACFYEPTVNRTYAAMAAHYGTAIIPARPYKPRDKAKVEVGVQVGAALDPAWLRHRRFSRWRS